MDARAFLSATDTKTEAGWPNPRWRMTDLEAILARMSEDAARITAERGLCCEDDLLRLGWQSDTIGQANTAGLKFDPLPPAGFVPFKDRFRGKDPAEGGRHLGSDDITFGCEAA